MLRGFGYGAQGDDDVNWGCVYRSVQNVQLALFGRASALATLVSAAGRTWGAWSEPADFVAAASRLFPHCRVTPILAGSSRQWLKYTVAQQYETRKSDATAIVLRANAQTAFVVDDGVSGYAVVPARGQWWWVDPHTGPAPAYVPFTDQLSKKPGWMMLRVTRLS